MKPLSKHIKESFNENKDAIVENQESPNAKESKEVVENGSSEKDEQKEE